MNSTPSIANAASVVVQSKKDRVPGLGRGPGHKDHLDRETTQNIFSMYHPPDLKSLPTDLQDLSTVGTICLGIESVIKRKCEGGAFADDIIIWKSDSDLTKLERDINLVLEDIRNFALDHKLTFNPTKSMARKRLNILRYTSGRDWGADTGTLRNTYISLTRSILEYGVPVYCSASVTNLQKLEKVQLSTARIITGLRNTCPRDKVLFEADLQPLSLRRRACLTKYYNKLRSLDSRNHTSAYFKDWCNNQRLRRNSPFSQMVSFNLAIGAVEPPLLSQCLDPVDDLDGVFFHPELPVHVNK
ncbi:RNase H domain-containing protein [Trichonephila clavipes]|nr:RNase H domain-containing protein [Trichonephila clavipes]